MSTKTPQVKDTVAALARDVEAVARLSNATSTKALRYNKANHQSNLNLTTENELEQQSSSARAAMSNTTTNSTLVGLINGSNLTAYTFVNTHEPMEFASIIFHNGRVKPDPNATYGTTIGLILLLHVVFLFQWNARKTRRDVLATYHQLVKRKHFHRAIVAIVSHPPADPLTARERSNLAIQMGDASSSSVHESYGRMGRLRQRCRSFANFLYPVSFGHLSGLPLLTYNSHLLWSCRALEGLCPSSWYYARFLIALVLVSLLLELRLTDKLLESSRAITSIGFSGVRASLNGEHHRVVLHRTMGTPTMLTSAILLVYRCALPHVGIPVLPFLPVSRRMDVGITYFTSSTLLAALSWKSHPVTSVLCGTFSGLLWVFGVTSFLGDAYWGNVMLGWITMACLLSMRGTLQLAGWVPCVDYVAWDSRGRIRLQGVTFDQEQQQQEQAEEGEVELPIQEEDDIESRPFLTRRSDSLGLRGRVPQMDMEDEIEMPRTPGTSHGLSQRRSGLESSSLHHRYE